MALNISEGQFVLPGSSAPDALSHLSQTLFMRNIQNQRLELAREQKRDEAAGFIQQELNPEHFGTGTIYDPVINQNLSAIRQRAFAMATNGADKAAIQMAIGPAMDKLNQYQMTAKTVAKNVDDYLKVMHENKMDEGYKMGDLRQAALQSAFTTKDKDGNIALVDPSNVNPSVNYIQKAINDNPGAYTTDEALINYAKNSPKSTRQSTITTHDQLGNTSKRMVDITGANWEIPEADAKGNITMVPNYDYATDNGQVIMHTGPDGRQQPVRLFNEQHFNQMMASKPAIADYIKGEVQQHLNDYRDANGKPIDLSSPSAKLLGRAIAYQILAANNNSSVKSVQDLNKPSGAEVAIHVYGNKEQQSYDRTMGNLEAKSDAGAAGLTRGKENTIQSLVRVFNNDPNYLDGAPTKVNGTAVIDITNKLPKGQLKYVVDEQDQKAGKKTNYQGVYYDPAGRQLILKNMHGGIETISESHAGQFFARIAEANGVPLSAVKPAMAAGGWSGGEIRKCRRSPTDTATGRCA